MYGSPGAREGFDGCQKTSMRLKKTTLPEYGDEDMENEKEEDKGRRSSLQEKSYKSLADISGSPVSGM
jgi:hypothetical protein